MVVMVVVVGGGDADDNDDVCGTTSRGSLSALSTRIVHMSPRRRKMTMIVVVMLMVMMIMTMPEDHFKRQLVSSVNI